MLLYYSTSLDRLSFLLEIYFPFSFYCAFIGCTSSPFPLMWNVWLSVLLDSRRWIHADAPAAAVQTSKKRKNIFYSPPLSAMHSIYTHVAWWLLILNFPRVLIYPFPSLFCMMQQPHFIFSVVVVLFSSFSKLSYIESSSFFDPLSHFLDLLSSSRRSSSFTSRFFFSIKCSAQTPYYVNGFFYRFISKSRCKWTYHYTHFISSSHSYVTW